MKILLVFLALCLAPICVADDIELADGRTFHGARVVSSDPASLVIAYAGGVETVSLASCSLEMQVKYGYSEEKARAFIEERQAALEARRAKTAEEAARKDEITRQATEAALVDRVVRVTDQLTTTLDATFPERRWRVAGEVFQVVEGGALVEPSKGPSYETEMIRAPNPPSRRHADPVMLSEQMEYERALKIWQRHVEANKWDVVSGDLIFVAFEAQGIYDGARIDAYVVPDGVYSYTNSLGARRTVPRYNYIAESPFL